MVTPPEGVKIRSGDVVPTACFLQNASLDAAVRFKSQLNFVPPASSPIQEYGAQRGSGFKTSGKFCF